MYYMFTLFGKKNLRSVKFESFAQATKHLIFLIDLCWYADFD